MGQFRDAHSACGGCPRSPLRSRLHTLGRACSAFRFIHRGFQAAESVLFYGEQRHAGVARYRLCRPGNHHPAQCELSGKTRFSGKRPQLHPAILNSLSAPGAQFILAPGALSRAEVSSISDWKSIFAESPCA